MASQKKFYEQFINEKTMDKLVSSMNDLLKKMEQGNNTLENKVASSIKKNFTDIPYLSMIDGKIVKKEDENNNTIGKELYKKNNVMQSKKNPSDLIQSKIIQNQQQIIQDPTQINIRMNQEGGDGDDVCDISGSDKVVVREAIDSLRCIQEQISDLNKTIINERNKGNHDLAGKLTTQLQQFIMIEHMTKQRIEALNILKKQASMSQCKSLLNEFSRYAYTGFSGCFAYYILKLLKDTGGLITGTGKGIISLICVGVMNAISNTVNGVTSKLPSFLGGGANVMDDGRNIVGNFTNDLGNYVGDIPEIEQFTIDLANLGYTTNIVLFIVLFCFAMIIGHSIRMCQNADSFSIPFIRVEGNTPGYQALPNMIGNQEFAKLNNGLNNGLNNSNSDNSQRKCVKISNMNNTLQSGSGRVRKKKNSRKKKLQKKSRKSRKKYRSKNSK